MSDNDLPATASPLSASPRSAPLPPLRERSEPPPPPAAAASAPLGPTDVATAPPGAPAGAADIEALAAARDRVVGELRKRIVGQADVVDLLLTAMFARGHALFIGVPGLAKTLLISTLAQSVSLEFNRIQFTPDLMPSDITGTDILEQDATTGERAFRFVKGPIFSNVLLADEINRTPPKTQAALLQAMQERRVTAGGRDYPLEPPFIVYATQNPIEQEGTYPLPEAQLDRFMFSINVGYPSVEEEIAIVSRTTGLSMPPIEPVLSQAELLRHQEVVLQVVAAPDVVRHAVQIASASRPSAEHAPSIVREFVSWGAGPRASQFLVIGAKARAALNGRPQAGREDVDAVLKAVLGHRVVLNFHAEAERISVDEVLEGVRSHVGRN